jgi:hypothetical protein
VLPDWPGLPPVLPGGPPRGFFPLFPGLVPPEVGAEEEGVAVVVGELLDEPLVVEDGDDEVEEGDEDGAADVGALIEGDEGEDDEVGAVDEGDEEDVVVGELEEGWTEDGAAALRLADDIKEREPELNRIAERDSIITRDNMVVFLLMVTLELLLLLSLLLSISPCGLAMG